MDWHSHTPPAPRVPAQGSSPPRTARPVQVDVYVCVCVWLGSGSVPSQVPSVFICYGPARRRWRVGASSRALRGCPGASASVVCALRGSLSCTWWVPRPCVSVWCLWHMVRCDVRVVCWLDDFTAAWSGIGVGGLPFVARVALLACVGGLTFIVRVCLWWFPALVPACLCIPNHCVSS